MKTSATRREIVASAIGGLATFGLGSRVDAATKKPESQPPQAGDRFMITKGKQKGDMLRPGLLTSGEAPAIGFPFDPKDEILRQRSRLNRLLLVQLDSAEMDEETRSASAEGILVYSAVCTHQGCTIEAWKAEQRHFQCPCHASEFAALSLGSVRGGPATRPLAIVPVTIDDAGYVVATDGFSRKPGPGKG